MKKTYSKPDIFFEDFTLSTNIAGDCEGIVGNPSKDACAVVGTGGINMFSGTLSFCDFKPEDLGGPVVFLASEASDYITGAIIPVDGGYLSM